MIFNSNKPNWDRKSIVFTIIDIEQEKYPYYIVDNINILNINDDIVSYLIDISSKLDAKYRLTINKSINLSSLIEKIRDRKIDILINK